jgi:hypothetical protein
MRLSDYKKRGFIGIDASLEISLWEYGLIWKEFKKNWKKRGIKKGEVLAIAYRYGYVDHGYFQKQDLLDADWVEWPAVASCVDLSVEELQEQSTGYLLFELIGYYGPEEFGFFTSGTAEKCQKMGD